MATGNFISCKSFASFLVSQEPVYDKQILSDVRPFDGLIGYYETGAFDAYSGTTHTFDRFNSVFPNTTTEWASTNGGSCVGTPCDQDEAKIGWGYTRRTYSLEQQSWGSDLLCFDQIMTKTRAKEHYRQIIDEVLRPATNWIMTAYLQRKAFELAGKRICVATGLPEWNFTWDAGGYVYLNVTNASGGGALSPTGRLTAEILRTQIKPLYAVGAVQAGKEGFENLQLHTDIDTFRYLGKEAPTLYDAWRFGEFGPAAKEFYKYGFTGYIGDFMVKCLQFPLRFNKVADGRFQQVLPYTNEAATEGIRSVYNTAYDNAQYQISVINNPRALKVMPFKPEAVNAQMPFMVRDYGGKWQFVTNDLGADCNGRPIDNSRGNKGKFIADFRLAVKPQRDEWLVALFHKVDKPCVTIIDVCNSDPGYPAQDYNSANTPCDSVVEFTAVQSDGGTYDIAVGGITCDGNVVTMGGAISEADIGDLVTAIQAVWDAEGLAGDWTVEDETAGTIQLTGGTCTDVSIAFDL